MIIIINDDNLILINISKKNEVISFAHVNSNLIMSILEYFVVYI